jgi:hypothetical protein
VLPAVSLVEVLRDWSDISQELSDTTRTRTRQMTRVREILDDAN